MSHTGEAEPIAPYSLREGDCRMEVESDLAKEGRSLEMVVGVLGRL